VRFRPLKSDGCHANLEAALLPGSRLTVWVVNANGSAKRLVYDKTTGEAIDR